MAVPHAPAGHATLCGMRLKRLVKCRTQSVLVLSSRSQVDMNDMYITGTMITQDDSACAACPPPPGTNAPHP